MGISPSPQTASFLSHLNGLRQTGNGWVARCPCRNDDSNPSLSVGQGDDGRTLITCHRAMSCNIEQICSSVGMRVADLMPNTDEPVKRFTTNTSASVAVDYSKKSSKPKFVESYDYLDEHGVLLFQKIRYVEENGKKTFRQRKPDGRGGWEYSLGDIPKVLFNLPAVLKAKKDKIPIWVVEGEKDANTLNDLGFVATTMPGGAGKWLEIHTETLAGAIIEIVADKDEIGIKHAKTVLDLLLKAGCDAQAWVCPSQKDITDHITSGADVSDLTPISEAEIPLATEENKTIELSPENETIEKLKQLIERDDLSAKQKIAKSNLIIATSTVSFVLDSGRLVKWTDFLNESDKDSYDWVIPGLIERGERVIVVAAEGVGKTMLARQVGILCGAGIHPFSFQPIPRVRTLSVDLENPERIIRRTSRSIASQALHQSGGELDAYILTKPSGMNLLQATDRAILEEAIEEIKPHMLIIGPLYKAFLDPGNRTSEAVAIEVAKYLDTLRVVYNCALWIEHHAPLGSGGSSRDLRPFGSAVWSRWPEFGISLLPDATIVGEYVYDIKHFRGARDERQWPLKIKRGKRFPFEVVEWNKVGS